MKTFRASFDSSSLGKMKILIIIAVLAFMWIVVVPALFALIGAFIESDAVTLVIFTVAAVATMVLGIRLMLLINQKHVVTADDKSVKLICGNQETELLYSDIDSVSYSFADVMNFRYYGDKHRYALVASIRLKSGKSISLSKDHGSVYKSQYQSAEKMTELIGDKSDETALLAYIKSRSLHP